MSDDISHNARECDNLSSVYKRGLENWFTGVCASLSITGWQNDLLFYIYFHGSHFIDNWQHIMRNTIARPILTNDAVVKMHPSFVQVSIVHALCDVFTNKPLKRNQREMIAHRYLASHYSYSADDVAIDPFSYYLYSGDDVTIDSVVHHWTLQLLRMHAK